VQAVGSGGVLVGAQDAYFENNGAFTGEISVDMLKDVGVKFVLTGHSERRHVINEPGELVAKKAAKIYGSGLILVHCVGEKLEERDANQTMDVCRRQMDELDPKQIDDPSRLVIAYEPVWAIGTGRNATDAQAQEVHAALRDYIKSKWNQDFADNVRIQYGGSMKPENAAGLLKQPDVDGGLIGGAALKADSFLAIVKAAV
jgi:triosephosphate isomerase